MSCRTVTSSVACLGGWQVPGGGGGAGAEGIVDPTRAAEHTCRVGQALGASSLDPGLLPFPLRAGDAVAELLHPGDCAWPAPQVPGGLGQWAGLEAGWGRAAPFFWMGLPPLHGDKAP